MSPPNPPLYRAFTISPSSSSSASKPSFATPAIKESTFPQPSLISELSSLQENHPSPIADKIANLSTEQRNAVYQILVDLVGREEDVGEVVGGREKGEWSVCEAVKVRGRSGRTRCVRVFFVRAVGRERANVSRSRSRGTVTEVGTNADVDLGSEVKGEGKGKEKEKERANISRSRSRAKEKTVEITETEIPPEIEKEKSRRKSTRERSSERRKEIEKDKAEEKKSRRKSTKPKSRRKKEEDDECSCTECVDSALSFRSPPSRPKPRSLSQRFKPRNRESVSNPTAYGRTEWKPPVIIPSPPTYPAGGYNPVPPANEYHIRAAYEAGQRDALAERLRNAALERERQANGVGPSHVISFERLRPGFEEWSEGSFSQMAPEPEIYVNQRRPQYPRPMVPEVPFSYVGSGYGRDSYVPEHFDRRYPEEIRTNSSYDRYAPDSFRRRYTAAELPRW